MLTTRTSIAIPSDTITTWSPARAPWRRASSSATWGGTSDGYCRTGHEPESDGMNSSYTLKGAEETARRGQ